MNIFLPILSLFLINTVYSYQNILENSNIIASQYMNTSELNLKNVVNGEEFRYSTGPIDNLPIYIYFNLEDKHFTTVYKFYWSNKPKTYSFYISKDCNYNLNYTYFDTNNLNQKNISFYNSSYFVLFIIIF